MRQCSLAKKIRTAGPGVAMQGTSLMVRDTCKKVSAMQTESRKNSEHSQSWARQCEPPAPSDAKESCKQSNGSSSCQ